MPTKRLTELFVKKVVTTEPRLEVRDALVRGLDLRVTSNGAKSWSVLYTRRSDGKRRRFVIGAYPTIGLEEARAKAKACIADVANGGDPAKGASERRDALTFKELAALWLDEHATPNKAVGSVANDRSMLRRHIEPSIGAMRANEVKKRDISSMLSDARKAHDMRFSEPPKADADGNAAPKGRRKGNPKVLTKGRTVTHLPNRVFELVRSIYRWAVKQDLVKTDPTWGLERPIKKEKTRERVLTDTEVNRLWHGIGTAPITESLGLAMKLALATGQRIGEISTIEKSSIDIMASTPVMFMKSDDTKNDRPHRVPLSPLALELVKRALVLSGKSKFLFPSPETDSSLTEHAATRAFGRFRPKLGLEDCRVHDLRRTAATGMAKLKISPHTISLVLNHAHAKKGTVTLAVYIDEYSYDDEKAAALNAWGAKLKQIVSQPAVEWSAAETVGTLEETGQQVQVEAA